MRPAVLPPLEAEGVGFIQSHTEADRVRTVAPFHHLAVIVKPGKRGSNLAEPPSMRPPRKVYAAMCHAPGTYVLETWGCREWYPPITIGAEIRTAIFR